MSIALRLPGYDNYSVAFDRARFLELFGDTVIGSAINLDPGAEVIEITNSEITPDVLNELMIATVPEKSNTYSKYTYLGGAWNYLGGRLIPVLSSPNYTASVGKDILNPHRMRTYYKELILTANDFNWPELAEYIGYHISNTLPDDEKMLDKAGATHDWFVRYLFNRGVTPTDDFIIRVINGRDVKLIQDILEHPNVDPAEIADIVNGTDVGYMTLETFSPLYNNPRFYSALDGTSIIDEMLDNHTGSDIYPLLLDDPRVDLEYVIGKAIVEIGDMTPLQSIMENKRVDPTYALHLALSQKNLDLVDIILDRDDADPNIRNHEALRLAWQNADEELASKILNHPQSDVIPRK